MHLQTTNLSFFDKVQLKDATFQSQSFPLHFHDTYSIGIIEQGMEQIQIEGKKLWVLPKSIFIVNAYACHANQSIGTDNVQYKSLYVSGDVLRFLSKKNGFSAQQEPLYFKPEPIQDTFLYNNLFNFHQKNGLTVEPYLSETLRYITRHYLSKNTTHGSPKEDTLVLETQAYLKANLATKINLAQWATLKNISVFCLIRRFKNATGITPGAYHLMHKIDYAKQLIQQNMPLTEVGYAAGFYDQSHFIRFFKSHVGVTPSVFLAGLTSF